MGMTNRRPVHLNLLQIRFPITAIVSIIHRVTGVLLFFFIPVALWMLGQSLDSKDSYLALMNKLDSTCGKLIVFAGFASFSYHLLAGFRHILMDFGFAESKEGGSSSSVWLIIVYLACLLGLGVWVW